jgi:hypothetical protein
MLQPDSDTILQISSLENESLDKLPILPFGSLCRDYSVEVLKRFVQISRALWPPLHLIPNYFANEVISCDMIRLIP